jgi:hypothetical protein
LAIREKRENLSDKIKKKLPPDLGAAATALEEPASAQPLNPINPCPKQAGAFQRVTSYT